MARRRCERFRARLTGASEVPPVETNASGTARLRVLKEGLLLQTAVLLRRIENVTQAHIHLGQPGENGPVVAFLLSLTDPVDFRRGRITRTLTRGDLVGPLAGQPLSALIEQIRAGNAYVNVHTTEHPDGEIRGQVERA